MECLVISFFFRRSVSNIIRPTATATVATVDTPVMPYAMLADGLDKTFRLSVHVASELARDGPFFRCVHIIGS